MAGRDERDITQYASARSGDADSSGTATYRARAAPIDVNSIAGASKATKN